MRSFFCFLRGSSCLLLVLLVASCCRPMSAVKISSSSSSKVTSTTTTIRTALSGNSIDGKQRNNRHDGLLDSSSDDKAPFVRSADANFPSLFSAGNKKEATAAAEKKNKQSADLAPLILRVCYAVGATWMYPNEFLRGTTNTGLKKFRPPLVLLAFHEMIYFGIRVLFSYRTKSGWRFSANERRAEPKLPTWILLISVIGVLVNIFSCFSIFLAPHWVSFATLPHYPHATILGIIFSVAALSLQFLSHWHLGDSWSTMIETKHDQQLITRGVYSFARHPMYLAFLLSAMATTILSGNWLYSLSYWSIILAAVARIPTEEAMMKDQFGAVYESYCRQTPLLFPRFFPTP